MTSQSPEAGTASRGKVPVKCMNQARLRGGDRQVERDVESAEKHQPFSSVPCEITSAGERDITAACRNASRAQTIRTSRARMVAKG